MTHHFKKSCFLTLCSLLAFDVAANTPPVISGMPETEVVAGRYWQFSPIADDADDGDSLMFRVVGLPSWAGFSPATGELSGFAKVSGDSVKATQNVWFAADLYRYHTGITTAGFDPANSATYSVAHQVTVHDDNGSPHALGLYFKKTLNEHPWQLFLTFDGQDLGQVAGSGVAAEGRSVAFGQWGFTSPRIYPAIKLNLGSVAQMGEVTVHLQSSDNRYGLRLTQTDDKLHYFAQDGVSRAEAQGSIRTIITVADSANATARLPEFKINVSGMANQDHDGDGVNDSLDTDDDNDQIPDPIDAFDFDPAESLDTDLDGIGNNKDDDDDNDGIADSVDPQPLVSSVNRAPVISGQPRRHAFAGSRYGFTPTVTDADGDTVSFTIKNKPSWAQFDSTTGRLSGVNIPANQHTDCGNADTYAVGVLDSRLNSPVARPFDPSDPATYNYHFTMEIDDALKRDRHILGVYFVKASAQTFNTWNIHLTINGVDLSSLPGSGVGGGVTGTPVSSISFKSNGEPAALPSIALIGDRNSPGSISSILTNGAWFADVLRIKPVLKQFSRSSFVKGQVYAVDCDVDVVNLGSQDRQAQSHQSAVQQLTYRSTNYIYYAMNLDARASAPLVTPFSYFEPQSYNYRQRTTIYDSMGQPHEFAIHFAKAQAPAINSWNVYLTIDGTDLSSLNGSGVGGGVAGSAVATLTFNSNAEPVTSPASFPDVVMLGGSLATNTISAILNNGATFPAQLILRWQDVSGTVKPNQYASDFEKLVLEQDGVSIEEAKQSHLIEIKAVDSHGNVSALPKFSIDIVDDSDNDNDLIGDAIDPDDDNDGLPDSIDSRPLDTDNDGIDNAIDDDDDGDGVPDNQDAFPLDGSEFVDTDNDGIGNVADNDDDGDGTLDHNDPYPLDGSRNKLDDTDGDGVSDQADHFPLDPSEWQDHDYDGIGNNADSDDDGDGVLDGDDAFPLDGTESVDSDGDGIGNNADLDDDNDGVMDTEDAFPLSQDETLDTDGDGIGNNADTDDDNDNVADINDAFPLDKTESVDTDGDGIGNNADTDDDNDTLSDATEVEMGTNPLLIDTDGDGLADNEEAQYGTSALMYDTDGDGLSDGFEVAYGYDPLLEQSENGSNADSDNDGLTNAQEMALGTNPNRPDSDDDGIEDGLEVNRYTTNPLNGDSDDDGLSDLYEIEQSKTNPNKADTDNDKMLDAWEVQYLLDPNLDDSHLDTDLDGRDNLTEFEDKTNPIIAEILDKEENESLATAQKVDHGFNLAYSANIGDSQHNTSELIPHVTVMAQGRSEADMDFFEFTVTKAGSKVILDIDEGLGNGSSFDAYIELYNASGRILYANDDANWTGEGQGGSRSITDSYLELIVEQPGVYYVRVLSYASNYVADGSAYTLHISVENTPLQVD